MLSFFVVSRACLSVCIHIYVLLLMAINQKITINKAVLLCAKTIRLQNVFIIGEFGRHWWFVGWGFKSIYWPKMSILDCELDGFRNFIIKNSRIFTFKVILKVFQWANCTLTSNNITLKISAKIIFIVHVDSCHIKIFSNYQPSTKRSENMWTDKHNEIDRQLSSFPLPNSLMLWCSLHPPVWL